MPTIETFTWSATSNPALAATAAGRVLRRTPGAGVTGRVSLQITNQTDADVFVNDSGTPATDASSAKYVIPPRCTATHPLGQAGQVTFTWNGGVLGSADYVDIVFTDDELTSAVWPGTIAAAGSSSPVQTYLASVLAGGTGNVALTTTSGRNVGNVFVYNATCSPVDLINFLPGPPVTPLFLVTVPAYSWATIPLNIASGQVQVDSSSSPSAWIGNDALYVAWSDVNYVGPFPAGAGKLPSPFDAGQLPPTAAQFGFRQSIGGCPATANWPFSIPAGRSLIVTDMTVGLVLDAAGVYDAGLYLPLGWDGASAAIGVKPYVWARGVGGTVLHFQDRVTAPFRIRASAGFAYTPQTLVQGTVSATATSYVSLIGYVLPN